MAVAALAVATAAPAGAADTQARAKARLESIAAYAPATAICKQLGWPVSEAPDDFGDLVLAEAVKGGMKPQEATDYFLAAVKRQGELFEADLNRLGDAMMSGKPARAAVQAYADRMDRTCAAAAADPIAHLIVGQLPPAKRAELKAAFVEDLLARIKQASWQTPGVLARADLVSAVGACRRFLTQTEIDRDLAGLIVDRKPADPAKARELAFYDEWYANGLKEAAELNFDETECQRVMEKSRAAVAAAG